MYVVSDWLAGCTCYAEQQSSGSKNARCSCLELYSPPVLRWCWCFWECGRDNGGGDF